MNGLGHDILEVRPGEGGFIVSVQNREMLMGFSKFWAFETIEKATTFIQEYYRSDSSISQHYLIQNPLSAMQTPQQDQLFAAMANNR
jgi:hypothetical protein